MFSASSPASQRGPSALLPADDPRLQFVLACSGLGLWEWYPPTRQVRIDARCRAFLGLESVTPPGDVDFWRAVVHPDDLPRVADVARAHCQGTTPFFEVQVRLRHRSGTWINILARGRVLERLASGQPGLLCGTLLALDVSERPATTVPRHETLLARIFHNCPVMMGLHRVADGALVEVNDRFVQTLGYPREELIGRRPVDVGWATPASRDYAWAQLFAKLRVRDVPLELISKSGESVLTRYSGELLEIDGELYALSAWRDITDTVRMEGEMRLQSAALAAAANAIIITDRAGRIEWANPAAIEMTGYSLAEMTGRKPGELFRSGEHDAAFYADLWRTIAAGHVWSGEITNRRKDGSRYPEEMTITPIRGEGGEIEHYVAVKQDIATRRDLERQFLQAQKMEAVGQLAGGVAHDFNNILAAMLLHVGLLRTDPAISAELHTVFHEFEKQVQRGAALTRQLLTFSRQEAMVREALDANTLITGLIKMLRRLIGEHIDIAFQPAADLPAIHADPGMIEQVVTNLCVNARDAMPRGGRLTLTTRGHDAALPPTPIAPGHFISIEVKDTGCGMDAATQRRVFEPFFTTKPVGQGTGLGLSTVYGIAQQHGGWVELESAVGVGTTFRVFLPAIGARTTGPRAVAPASPVGHGETVLLVEDDAILRNLTSKALVQLGYRPITAGSGPEALGRWEEHEGKIDLLLTDMVMPGGMDGRELARLLRAKQPALKVILSSGYSERLVAESLDTGEAMALLRKPYGQTTLASLLARQFGRAPGDPLQPD